MISMHRKRETAKTLEAAGYEVDDVDRFNQSPDLVAQFRHVLAGEATIVMTARAEPSHGIVRRGRGSLEPDAHAGDPTQILRGMV